LKAPTVTARSVVQPDDDARELLQLGSGGSTALWRVPGSGWRPRIDPPPHGLLSGSFNPRHSGHDALRDAAEAWIGGPVCFELPLVNADKPALEVDEAAVRSRQFDDHPLLVTRAATFVEKAQILPGVTFVVGVDTAFRIVAPRFYSRSDDPRPADAAMLAGLAELRDRGCRFLVAARTQEGQVLRLADVPVPDAFHGLFAELPVDRFLCDLSSSELRGMAADDP